MASDYWTWHSVAGKPWMQERAMERGSQPKAEVGTAVPPAEPPDKPRVLFRLYCTVDPDHETETMSAREYAVFCTDYADTMQEYAHNCRLKQKLGEKYKWLGNRVPTQENCVAAELLSEQAEQRRCAAEGYAANPEGTVSGGPPGVDELRAEFTTDPPSCPNRLELMLYSSGHDALRRRKLEALAGVPEAPWSLYWSSTHRLWFWSTGEVLEEGFDISTWLRPVRKSALRRALKAKVKTHLHQQQAKDLDASDAIDRIQTLTKLRVYLADPEQLLRDLQNKRVESTGAQDGACVDVQPNTNEHPQSGHAALHIDAISVLLGYDYRLKPNQPREYKAGADKRPLLSPSGLALDRDKNRLFVSEMHRIRVLSLDGSAPAEVIAGFQGMDPVAGFKDGEGSEAQFHFPTALAFDPKSRLLFVADTGNHAIRTVEETDSGWYVATIVGTGEPGGFGGPAIEYTGRIALHSHVNQIVKDAKDMAKLSVAQKNALDPEQKALLSKARSTGFRYEVLGGNDEGVAGPAVEWRASIDPLRKQETVPEMDGKPINLPAHSRGRIATHTYAHGGKPLERMLVVSADSSRVQDIAPLDSKEIESTVDVCIELRGATGLSEAVSGGDERGYAAVITWGPGASSLRGDDGSGADQNGLLLLRQRTMPLESGESGHPVRQTGCWRWCTAMESGPDPIWNEVVNVRVPHGENIEIVVDIWSAASLCAPQTIALNPAISSDEFHHLPELLIGCGDTHNRGIADAQAQVDRCDSALSALDKEDTQLSKSLEKGQLTVEEQAQLKERQTQVKDEQEAFVRRRRTARAKSTAAHSIRLLQVLSDTRASRNGVLQSLVRGGDGIVDPCAIVLQPHESQRRYVVMEGCSRRLLELHPNGYFRPMATTHENSTAVCYSPSGASMYTIGSCTVKHSGILSDIGRLRQATFHWQWGEEKFLPSRIQWHNFDEPDRSEIERLYRDYVNCRTHNAHIAQFTMPKDHHSDLDEINTFRFVEASIKELNRSGKTRRVPIEPVLHLLRNHGAVTPGKRGRLLDFETMRTAIDSTIRRPITQYCRVAPRNSNDLLQVTGKPMNDPVKGKVGGFFSEWVKVRWDDSERDKRIVKLIVDYRKQQQLADGVGAEQLMTLSSTALRAEALKITDKAVRRKLREIHSESLRHMPGADKARQDLMRRKAKASHSETNAESIGEPLLRSPWVETSSLKVVMSPTNALKTTSVSCSKRNVDNLSVPLQVGSELPRKHAGHVPRRVMSPVERWLLRYVNAGSIPWLEPLAEVPTLFREFSCSLQTKIFQPGKTIIAGGMQGSVDEMPMYILTAGEAQALGKLAHTPSRYPPEQTVMKYNTPGQTFGELAMLTDSGHVRAATVKAVTKCTVFVVTRALFAQFVRNEAVCMQYIRNHTPADYWGEYKELRLPNTPKPDNDTPQKRTYRAVSHQEVRSAPMTRQRAAQKSQTRQGKKPRANAVTRKWTSGPGGGGPVTALPADLNWRELRRSDGCTLHTVRGCDQLPLRDPRAVLSLDEKTLIIADRWIDEETDSETGAIWKVRLDMLKMAEDLKVVADNCFRTHFYRRALDSYTTADAIFGRNQALESMIEKTTRMVKMYGDEPGKGPTASTDESA